MTRLRLFHSFVVFFQLALHRFSAFSHFAHFNLFHG